MLRRGGYGGGYGDGYGRRTTRGSGMKLRLLIAGGIVLFSLFSYLRTSDVNPITGKAQRVAIDPTEEIQLGLASRQQMAAQHGGLHPNQEFQQVVDKIGLRLVNALDQRIARESNRTNPYSFEFHLLQDPNAVNAFALPGGQVFITYNLFERIRRYGKSTDFGGPVDRLAGVLGHEVGHVIARHGAQRMAKQKLTQGLIGAASVGGGNMQSGQMAAMIGKMVNMKYGRGDELEADQWGVALSKEAGFDPRAMLDVMEILEESAPGGGPPEMMSTHPKPKNRKAYITKILKEANIPVE